MSGVPSTPDSNALGFASALGRIALAPIEVAAFWAAIVLPVAYLPLLVGGIGADELPLFVGLLALHAATLVLGRGHARD